MNQFRLRLTSIFIVVIGLSVLAAGLFMAKMLENSQIAALRKDMARELRIIRMTTRWEDTADLAERQRYFNDLARALRTSADARLTFIREDGTVMGDSDSDPNTMENHLDREEIAQARTEGIGYAIRPSETMGKNMLYAAIAVMEEGRIQGYERLSVSLEEVEASIRQLWMVLVAGLLVLFLAAGLISYRIAHNLTKPLAEIMRVAQQISNRNYSARVRIRNKDEVGLLGLAVNTMAGNLEQQMERIMEDERRLKSVLDHMISGVIMIDREDTVVLMNRSAEDILGFTGDELLYKKSADLKERIRFIPLLEKCRLKKERIREEMHVHFPEERTLDIHLIPILQMNEGWGDILIVLHDITSIRRLERMRSEFVANVSHELKTPVAAVKGYAETLLAGAMNEPETARSFLRTIEEESDRLNRLIGDILELSRIESKLVPLHFSPVELRGFMTKTLEMMRKEAEKKRLDLQLHVGEGLYMEADEDRLRQILINLLSNSINYTNDGGRIRLQADIAPAAEEDGEEKVRITISDTGMGIPKEDVPRIFERFYRVDKARSRRSGGTGLGLSIVYYILDMEKCDI